MYQVGGASDVSACRWHDASACKAARRNVQCCGKGYKVVARDLRGDCRVRAGGDTPLPVGKRNVQSRRGMRYFVNASEVFADRAYEDDGSLVARSKPGAVITDENEAIARVVRMVRESKVTSVNGKDISIKADSICVHGDNAHALEFVTRIRAALKAENISTAPLGDVISAR